MEELLTSLPELGCVEGDHDVAAKSAVNHADLYKCRPAIADSETRRKDWLQNQKEKRRDILTFLRHLTEEDDELEEEGGEREETVLDTGEEQEELGEKMEVQESHKRSWRERFRKKQTIYKEHLMQSEWMVDVPEDLEEQWLVKLCPEGQRRLVVACKGTTKVFTRTGMRDRRFPRQGFHSYLPGGSLTEHRRACTVLDCLYMKKEKMFYVLDPIAWNNQSFYEAETDFRFFWLDQKTRETPEISTEQSTANPYKFVPLPAFPYSLDNLETAMASSPFKVDGLLFFHKETHYTLGSTPLVLRLKPFMLSEVLGLPVAELYLAMRPPGYTDYRTYIASGYWTKQRNCGRMKRCKHGNNSMEIAESDNADMLLTPAIEATRDFDSSPAKSNSAPSPIL